MKILRKLFGLIFKVLAVIFGVVIVFFILFMLLLVFGDPNYYKDIIEKRFNQQTGQKLTLGGPIKIDYLPFPKIHLLNAGVDYTVKGVKYRFFAKDFSFLIDPFTLFAERIYIKGINAKNIEISIHGKDKVDQFMIDTYEGQLITTCCHAEVPRFKLTANGYDLSGNITTYFLANELQIKGKLKSNKWLSTLGFNKEDKMSNQLFSILPFTLKNNLVITGEVQYTADDLLLDNIRLRDANFNIDMAKESAQLRLTAKASEGELKAEVNMTIPKNGKTMLDIELDLKGAKASDFIKNFNPAAQISDGVMDLKFRGNIQVSDSLNWLKRLSGKLFTHIQGMRLNNQKIDTRIVDLFSAFLKMFNKSKNQTELECVAMRFQVREGNLYAHESIGIDTPEIYALGTGSINLNNNQLNLTFDVYPRSQANLTVGAYDNVIFLKGPINRPQVTVSPHGVMKSGGTVILGFMTSGLSLLAEKFYKVMTQRGSPCQQVLAEE